MNCLYHIRSQLLHPDNTSVAIVDSSAAKEIFISFYDVVAWFMAINTANVHRVHISQKYRDVLVELAFVISITRCHKYNRCHKYITNTSYQHEPTLTCVYKSSMLISCMYITHQKQNHIHVQGFKHACVRDFVWLAIESMFPSQAVKLVLGTLFYFSFMQFDMNSCTPWQAVGLPVVVCCFDAIYYVY